MEGGVTESPLTIAVAAPIPSKKNSRVTLRSGVTIPGEAYRKWHKSQLPKLRLLAKTRGPFRCPVSVSLGVSFGDRRRRDLDNTLSSVLDLLKDSGLILDDDWAHVRRVSAEVFEGGSHSAVVTVAPSEK